MKKIIARLADLFIQNAIRENQNPVVLRKSRFLVMVLLISCVTLMSLAVLDFMKYKIIFGAIGVFLSLFGATILFLNKKTGRTDIVGILTCFIVFAGIGLITWKGDGYLSTLPYWNVLIPLLASFFIMRSAGFIFAFLCVVEYGFFYLMALYGVITGYPLDFMPMEFAKSFSEMTGLYFFAAFIGWYLESSKEDSINLLKKSYTREVSSNRELAISKDKSKVSEEAKSEILKGFSQELHTPMNEILSYTNYLMEIELSDKQRNLIENIYFSSDKMIGIIHTLLDYSKIESSDLKLDNIPFDLRVTVDQTIRQFNLTKKNKNVEICSIISPFVPKKLKGDPGRIKQILRVLLENSLRFTDEGNIDVLIDSDEPDYGISSISFEIKDSGMGIQPELLEKLKLGLSYNDFSTSKAFGGTGLGLNIAKRLVHLMQGKIQIESELGAGSTFKFKIDLDLVPVKKQIKKDIPKEIPYLNILLLEPDVHFQQILQQSLQNIGMFVTAYSHFKDIDRDILENKINFDLVLTEWSIDGKLCLDIIKTLHEANDDGKDLKSIILTGTTRRGQGQECRDAGVNGFLSKPVSVEEILDAMRIIYNSKISENDLITRHTIRELFEHQKKKILVVDDNLVSQRIAASMLEKLDFFVEVAKNGKMDFAC